MRTILAELSAYTKPWRQVFLSPDDVRAWVNSRPKRVVRIDRLKMSPSEYCNRILRQLSFKEVFNRSYAQDFVSADGHTRHYTQREVLELFVPLLRTHLALLKLRDRYYRRLDRRAHYMLYGTWNSEQVRDDRCLQQEIPEEEVKQEFERWRKNGQAAKRAADEAYWNRVWP